MKFIISIFVLFIFFSCEYSEKKVEKNTIVKDSAQQAIKKTHKKKSVRLDFNTKKELESWKEYGLVEDLLSTYINISNEEALSNAKELSDLASQLIDSIPDKRLKSAPIKSRIHIFQNECLRLKDMANIPSISSEEVSQKIDDVLMGFSMLSAKLNAVFNVRNIENELELDPDFESILNDSTIVDIIIDNNEGASEIMKRARVKRKQSIKKIDYPLNKKLKKKIIK
jgi:hypothetical protein